MSMKTDHIAEALTISRAVRRAEHLRSVNRWPEWKRSTIKGVPGAIPGSWSSEFTEAFHNTLFAVLVRPLPGGWHHAMISTAIAQPPSWAEKQRIKDTLFGGRWAYECFPPRPDLVDGADAYHLWIMPPGERPPFTLNSKPPEDRP